MDIAYRSFLASKPFLIIGPSGAEFYVHGALISQCSPVLAVDVNGSMQEAESRIISIKDIDGDLDNDTVMRFIEFAYSGDYTVPPPEVHLTSKDIDAGSSNAAVEPKHRNTDAMFGMPPSPPSDPVDENYGNESPILRAEDGGWSFNSSSRKKKHKKVPSRNNWFDEPKPEPWQAEALLEAAEPPPKPLKRDVLRSTFCEKASVKKITAWEPSANDDPCEVYAAIFLCHARLYIFSNRYECDSLRNLSLQKLRLTLSRFQLHTPRSSDITELVRYTYTHTPNIKQGADKLRNLISDYVVCYIEQMCEDAEFLDILQEYDGLAKDLMVKLMSRLE